MADYQTIRSYLVGLGYAPDASFANLSKDLTSSRKLVEGFTLGITGDLLKWQASIIGMFTAVSGAIVGTVDKIAMADQEYRLFGERMGLGTQRAREYKMALDALGQPIEAVAWDPELHERFQSLLTLQREMAPMLGGDYEANMKKVRDIRFEFTKMQVEAQGFLMVFANDLVKDFGGGKSVLDYLQTANKWLLANIPRLAEDLSTDAIPVLKDTWGIVKDLGDMLGYAAHAFTNMVGIISGDNSLQGETTSFHDFARAVEDVVHWLAKFVQLMFAAEKLGANAVNFILGGGRTVVDGLNGINSTRGGDAQDRAVSGMIAAGKDFFNILGNNTAYDGKTSSSINPFAVGAGSDAARVAAAQVSALTGIDPALLYGQYAHETGGFTNRGAHSLNNLAGIRMRNGQYQKFDSLQDFVMRDAQVLSQNRYRGLAGTHDADEYARILKGGGYYEGPLADYQKGIRHFAPQYGSGAGGGDTHVTVGDIHITQPGASADEISRTVISQIDRKMRAERQRALVQADGAYA